jgi:hypothetical protein
VGDASSPALPPPPPATQTCPTTAISSQHPESRRPPTDALSHATPHQLASAHSVRSATEAHVPDHARVDSLGKARRAPTLGAQANDWTPSESVGERRLQPLDVPEQRSHGGACLHEPVHAEPSRGSSVCEKTSRDGSGMDERELAS